MNPCDEHLGSSELNFVDWSRIPVFDGPGSRTCLPHREVSNGFPLVDASHHGKHLPNLFAVIKVYI
jgi:hypothetical protein